MFTTSVLASRKFQAKGVTGCSSCQKPLAAACDCRIRTGAITVQSSQLPLEEEEHVNQQESAFQRKGQDKCQEEIIQDVVFVDCLHEYIL